MTPSQLEHLRLIDAYLDKLLDIAAKRTPGEWVYGVSDKECFGVFGSKEHRQPSQIAANTNAACVCLTSPIESLTQEDRINATFIASCAGNAEAGWLNTKNEIHELLPLLNPVPSGGYTVLHSYAQNRAESILSAWPIEMLIK